MVDSTCILTQGILYVEINPLRKAEPIQLYYILKKGKILRNSRHVLFIIFLKLEAKFDKLSAKTGKINSLFTKFTQFCTKYTTTSL